MKKEKVISIRFFSTMLVGALISSAVVNAPASFGIDAVQVYTQAQLIAAGVDPSTTSVKVAGNIDLTANLVINHSMTITRGDAYTTTTPVISGKGIEIISGAVVNLSNLTLNGLDQQASDGNYGVMVQSGSQLTASYLTMSLSDPGVAGDIDGFNVDSASVLSLSNSTITWGANVVARQQHAVYAQSGAGAITLSNNTFTFSARNYVGAYSYLVSMQGALVSNYPSLTLAGNTQNARLKALLVGADSVLNKQTWADTYIPAVQGDSIGILDGSTGGIYTKTAAGWKLNTSVTTAENLLTAVSADNAIINLQNSIAITQDLQLSKSLTINGNGFSITGKGIQISGAASVSISDMTLNGFVFQTGDGNYGVMIQAGSHLSADKLVMVLETSTATTVDMDGFNVDLGSSLTLTNSSITWGANVAGLQQYAVYAQSGAGAIKISSSTFVFNARNSAGAYSYLIGVQGDLVTNYPQLTLATLTNNSYMKFLMYGTGTLAAKQAWANANVTSDSGNNLVGIIGSGDNGVYKKYPEGWGVNNAAELIAAVAVANSVVNLNANISLSANLVLANGVSIKDNAYVLLLNGFEVSTLAATVVTVTRDVVTVVSGTLQSSQASLVAVPTVSILQLTETTTMTTTGGSGDGLVQYLTSSPTICSVSAAGVVTAIAVGSCLVTSTKAASGNYFAATSSVIAITVSDSAAVAAARAAVLKAIADRIEAERAAVLKAIADKIIADKAAADKAAAESGGGTVIAKSDLSTIRYAIATRTKTIFIDLADKYADQLVIVDVKQRVLVNGKWVLKFVPIDIVVLDTYGKAVIKTLVGIKAGNVLRVSIPDEPENILIKWVIVK
jgi:hypothetical protein